MEILNIVWTFFKIGIVSFGGGWSIVGLIQNEVVSRGWVSDSGFKAWIAIAQSTPGPVALNTATLVGWDHGGFAGAILATLSVIAFPVMAILAAGYLGKLVKPDEKSLGEALKTGSMAMMLMTLWALRPDAQDPFALALALASFALAAFTKINPLWAILGAGALDALLGKAIGSLFG